MKKRILSIIMVFVFLFSSLAVVEAKGRAGGFSGGRSSSKSFGGYSGSSSRSKIGSFSKSPSGSSKSTAKSSSGYTGSAAKSSGSSNASSSRSLPGSYSTKSNTSNSSASASAKSTYMADTYKKQSSSRNYKTYEQKLNAEQKKAYDNSYSRSYKVNNRLGFEDAMRTRANRINIIDRRPVYVGVNPFYFGGPIHYGSAYVGVWDLWFLMRASDLFWYHHWHDISAHRDYFEARKFAEMEQRVKALEAKYNGVRDENYLDPDVDPDLQFSEEYVSKNPDKVYYTNKHAVPSSNPFVVLIVISGIAVVLIIIIRKLSKPRPKKIYNSRIY